MLFARYFRPEVKEWSKIGEVPVYLTFSEIRGMGFKVPLIDLESKGAESRLKELEKILYGVPPSVTVRVRLEVRRVFDVHSTLSRSEAVRDLGRIKKTLLVFFEATRANYLNDFPVIIESMPSLGGESLSQSQIETYFRSAAEEVRLKSGLELGDRVAGVIRLRKPGTEPLSIYSLSSVLDELEPPFEITALFSPIPKEKSEMLMRQKLNRSTFSGDFTTASKRSEIESAIEDVANFGEELCEYEWLFSLERESEEGLRKALGVAHSKLKSLFDPYIETIGVRGSYFSTLPGGVKGYTLLERARTLSFLLPLATEGVGEELHASETSACLVHRVDGSLDEIDIFSKKNTAFNTIITGKTGSGKSVFGNVLSRALLFDANTHMIKIDVGGSYVEECREYGGEYLSFNLSRASGLDPFVRIRGDLKKEELSVLSHFLSSIAKEEGEGQISKKERSEFENAIEEYFLENSENRSFHHFLTSSRDLPRIGTLLRFGDRGVFSNAIRGKGEALKGGRYTYFNFEGILGASDPDYATAVMAAVIAEVNLKVIQMSGNAERGLGSRLILFCDETKFFMQRNGEFFLLTTANFRKFGHAVILLGQNIEDFKLTRDGRSDLGLILNSPNRIFFNASCDPEFLRENLSLDRKAILQITSGSSGTGYREFIYQSDSGVKTMRLYLTDYEYWATTSKREEVDLREKLKATFPGLSTKHLSDLITGKNLKGGFGSK